MYQTRQSVWKAITFWRILLIWTIIPIFLIIGGIIKAINYKVKIINNMIIKETGVFSKHREQYALAGIVAVCVDKTFFGGMFNYGDVILSLAGGKTVCLESIAQANEMEIFVQDKIRKTASGNHMFIN